MTYHDQQLPHLQDQNAAKKHLDAVARALCCRWFTPAASVSEVERMAAEA